MVYTRFIYTAGAAARMFLHRNNNDNIMHFTDLFGIVLHCKKRSVIFPSPAGMSLTKFSLAGNIHILPDRESLVSDIPAGDRKIVNLFLQCELQLVTKEVRYNSK